MPMSSASGLRCSSALALASMGRDSGTAASQYRGFASTFCPRRAGPAGPPSSERADDDFVERRGAAVGVRERDRIGALLQRYGHGLAGAAHRAAGDGYLEHADRRDRDDDRAAGLVVQVDV